MPDHEWVLQDLVKGEVRWGPGELKDFVLLRSDGSPVFLLAVAVDDMLMGVTHVVRGDDHISNTPKQVLLYRAFGAPVPRFAHVPLILGPDKRRLSKRHGATSVMEYKRQGYLPEAMVNFLALLGWSPGSDREVFTRDELIAAFSLEGISGGNAVFNPEKLDWFNGQHIARLDGEAIIGRLQTWMREAGSWRDSFEVGGRDRASLRALVELYKPRVRKLHDYLEHVPLLSDEVLEYEDEAVRKHLASEGLASNMVELRDALERTHPFDPPSIERSVRDVAASRGVKAAILIHATRIAVTGKAVSPGLFDILAILGRDRVIRRLDDLSRFLAVHSV
jgi:glutamyl-tRNA synthetase